MGFEEPLFQALRSMAEHSAFIEAVGVFLAEYLPYIIVLAFIVTSLKQNEWRKRAYVITLGIFSTALSAGIVASLIKFLYYRPRPFVALDFDPSITISQTSAFPSGHMMFLIPIALIVLSFDKKVGISMITSVVFVGLGRVLVGVHWPTDIIAGLLLGAALFYATVYILPKPFLEIAE